MRPIRPHEVVLFLQNPWFPMDTPRETIQRYATDCAFRKEVLATTMTGRRLISMFGEDWYNGMWIDNANPQATDHSRGWRPANHKHMSDVILARLPRVVVTMGLTAKRGFEALRKTGPNTRYFLTIAHLHCNHPNAMGITMDVLESFGLMVRGCMVVDHVS